MINLLYVMEKDSLHEKHWIFFLVVYGPHLRLNSLKYDKSVVCDGKRFLA